MKRHCRVRCQTASAIQPATSAPPGGRIARGALVFTVVLTAFLWFLTARPVEAHAFLIQSKPAAGARLARSPSQVVLDFTEPVLSPVSDRVTLVDSAGRPITVGPMTQSGGDTEVDVGIPNLGPGVYLVRWQVVSATDGHYSAGSFAFAVGDAGAVVPVAHASSPPDWPLALDSWVFLVALALCLGSVANGLWVWRQPPEGKGAHGNGPWAIAAAAGLARVALLAWSAAGSATQPSLASPRLWLAALGGGAGMWAILSLLLVLYAWTLYRRRHHSMVVFASLALGSLTLAMTSHPAGTPYWWARVAIEVHLGLAVLWTGMLARMVVETGAVIGRSSSAQPDLNQALSRYSKLALVLVVGIVSTGVLAALAEIRVPVDLVATFYGKVLVAKGILSGMALLLAWRARYELGPARPSDQDRIRRYMRPEGLAVVAILGASALLANVAPPQPRASLVAAASLLGPSPAGPDSITWAGRAGWLEVYLTASPKSLTLQTVTPQSLSPRDTRLLAADAPGGSAVYLSGRAIPKSPLLLVMRPCGAGCYTAPFSWRVGVTHVNVDVRAAGWSGGQLTFSVAWPPGPTGAALWRRALATMANEPSMTVQETVISNPHIAAHDTFYLTGRQWLATLPYSKSGPDVRRLSAHHGTSQVIVYLPSSLIWAHIWIAANGRFVREVIIDQGHEILHAYGYGRPAP